MVNAGNTTPITYEIGGRQYVVIAAFGGYDRRPGGPTGGRGQSPLPTNVGEGSPTGGAFIAFALLVASLRDAGDRKAECSCDPLSLGISKRLQIAKAAFSGFLASVPRRARRKRRNHDDVRETVDTSAVAPGRTDIESWPASALAQVTTADVVGTVTDSTGALLPGVTVTARNAAMANVETAVTDAEGNFQILRPARVVTE